MVPIARSMLATKSGSLVPALIAFSVAATPLGALRAQTGSTPAGWSSFTRSIDAYADSDRVVGTSALVMRDGKIVARHNYGFADIAQTCVTNWLKLKPL